MTNLEQLAERHMREYTARLKHIDELMERAEKAAAAKQGIPPEDLEEKRRKLADELLQHETEDWAEKGGPMVLWDIVAKRLEDIVERIEHH
jgi:hypothetical protein